MKNIFKYFLLLIAVGWSSVGWGQSCMPQNNDYTNWNWEDQNNCNWQSAIRGTWGNINPPFAGDASRLEKMTEVYLTSDYTKAKGWKLLTASFGIDKNYPYFILYNERRAIIRAFLYLDEIPFTHAAISCSYLSSSSKPGILTMGNRELLAADKYPYAVDNDMILVVIPAVGTKSWACADFPVTFDPNVTAEMYRNSHLQFKFLGCNNFNINIEGTQTPQDLATTKGQFTVTGKSGDFSSTLNKLSLLNTRLKKDLKTASEISSKVKEVLGKIPEDSKPFLLKFKKETSAFNNDFSTVIKGVSSVQPAIGAVLGILSTFAGSDPNSSTQTSPTATAYDIKLSGTMDINQVLNGCDLKVPGALKQINQPNPPITYYDCPLGLINLKTTPTVLASQRYRRWSTRPSGYTVYRVTSGYDGWYNKVKFNSDVNIVINNLSGVILKDIKFAVLFKPKKNIDSKLNYNITDDFNAEDQWVYSNGQTVNGKVPNIVYNDLNIGKLVLHNYDIDNDQIFYGSPYMDISCLKGFTQEVPEQTEVYLGVIAILSVPGSSDSYVFKANYAMNVSIPNTNGLNAVQNSNEQTLVYPYSDYYNGDGFKTDISSPSQNQYNAMEINLNSGMIGNVGFQATAKSYPSKCLGSNSTFENINLPSSCNNGQRVSFDDEIITQNSPFPNPIYSGYLNFGKLANEYVLYNSLGKVVKTGTNAEGFEVDNLEKGIYLLKLDGVVNKVSVE